MNKKDRSCNESLNNNRMNPMASYLFSLPPKQFSILSLLLGIILIDDLDLNQQNSLGNFIVGIGQTILVAAAQGQLLDSNNSQNGNGNVNDQIEMLKKQVSALEKELHK